MGRHHYIARVSIFLVAVALIVGMISCDGVESYTLTIASTVGGSVTTPGEGTFTYGEGTVVNLTAEVGMIIYRFVNWTGDVDDIADVNDATTTITMDDDYFITANFEQIPLRQFSLTISGSYGGSVTEPGEGTFTYEGGTVVSLVATPDVSYKFVNWTGDVGTIANVNAASTNITMQGDYEITADFDRLCLCIATGPFS